MNQISIAGAGVYVLIIQMILNLFGITPDAGSVMGVVNGVITVAGWALVIIGQLKRKDLTAGLIRK